MNIHQYIESGLVECYVPGLVSPYEFEELERMLPLHPELQRAIRAFESQLESFAFRHQCPPPPGVRNRIGNHFRALPTGYSGTGTVDPTGPPQQINFGIPPGDTIFAGSL